MNIVKSIKKKKKTHLHPKKIRPKGQKKIYTQSSLGILSKAQVSQIDLLGDWDHRSTTFKLAYYIMMMAFFFF